MAMKVLDEILESDLPSCLRFKIHLRKGDVLVLRGERNLAVAAYERSLALAPHDQRPAILLLIGEVKLIGGTADHIVNDYLTK